MTPVRDKLTMRQQQEAKHGKSAFTLLIEASRDAAPLTSRCVYCLSWKHEGTAEQGRRAVGRHLATKRHQRAVEADRRLREKWAAERALTEGGIAEAPSRAPRPPRLGQLTARAAAVPPSVSALVVF